TTSALFGQLTQPRHLGVPFGHREVGQFGRHQLQVEGARQPELRRPLHHPRVPGEPARLFGPRPQVGGPRRRQPSVDLVQRTPRPARPTPAPTGPSPSGTRSGPASARPRPAPAPTGRTPDAPSPPPPTGRR